MTARTLMLVGFLGLGVPGLLLLLWARSQSTALIEAPVQVDPPVPTVAAGSVSFSRGEHLVRHVLDCTGCHGPDLAGLKVMDSWLLGRFFSPNLTNGAGGIGRELDTAAWDLAIRHGVGRDGAPLLYMPSSRYAALSDRDLLAVIAYLERLPGQRREMLDSSPGPLFRFLAAIPIRAA